MIASPGAVRAAGLSVVLGGRQGCPAMPEGAAHPFLTLSSPASAPPAPLLPASLLSPAGRRPGPLLLHGRPQRGGGGDPHPRRLDPRLGPQRECLRRGAPRCTEPGQSARGVHMLGPPAHPLPPPSPLHPCSLWPRPRAASAPWRACTGTMTATAPRLRRWMGGGVGWGRLLTRLPAWMQARACLLLQRPLTAW